MSIPILATKLHIPTPRAVRVPRPRLIEHLHTGRHRKLILISAPAGFGKTTLISEWTAQTGQPVAWLSLDEADRDPTRFLTYFVAALQTVAPEIGLVVMDALQANQQPPVESVLTALLNDLAALPADCFLVLDDYHVIDSSAVDDVLAFLLDHLPPPLHLILTTREDPQLPLARLRVRDQLTELRVADLRFTPEEAHHFLNDTMGLHLSAKDISALETRTEGWVAGLQLAALSMQGHSDTDAFIDAFTGSHRFVVDYLVEEVLNHQPQAIRTFLLQTSILDRLNGSLCDAVTQQPHSQKMLDTLERGNLFVVPLDDTRHWYRYHHLFGDALRSYLQNEQPDNVAALHLRASAWYQQHSFAQDAIQHAIASGDFSVAADLIEGMRAEMEVSYQTAIWLGWVKALPEDLVRMRPLLCAGYGWATLQAGELETSEYWFSAAERGLDTSDNTHQTMQVTDDFEFQMLPASINSARAYRALAFGDIPATVHYAQRALALAGNTSHNSRSQANSLLGVAYWANGELATADQTLSAFVAEMQHVGRMVDAIEIQFIIADIRVTCGQLASAYKVYEDSFKLLADLGNPLLMGTEDLYRGVSDIYREWGKLDAAEDHLLTAEEISEQMVIRPDWKHRLGISWARLKITQGELDSALQLLDEAQQHYIRTPLPVLRPTSALKARIWIKQGKLDAAQAWVLQQGLSIHDDITYPHEFAYITLARLYLARYQTTGAAEAIQHAHSLLGRLLQAAHAGGRFGSAIEILILQALASAAQGNLTAALDALENALTLAEPEGYLRVFVDEGDPMQALLESAAQHGILPDYVQRLQNAFLAQDDRPQLTPHLADPLSERELEVLRLLITDLSGPDIARHLMVSLNTLRTHTKNIYSKLDVNNRRAAVRRAHELGVL